jgi:hypothetical protein
MASGLTIAETGVRVARVSRGTLFLTSNSHVNEPSVHALSAGCGATMIRGACPEFWLAFGVSAPLAWRVLAWKLS